MNQSRQRLRDRLFRRSTCPVPPPGGRRRIRPGHLVPLVGFLAPTALIGYGIVIPRSCIAGLNELSAGFAATLLGAAVTYLLGLRVALRG